MAPAPDGTPLYVHLPFCAAKCHYCDFFSVPDEGQDVDGLLSAVLREAEHRAPRRPRTVFLGGGTPSLLSTAQLARFLDALHALTGFRDSAVEVSAECNPESLGRDKARCLLDLGVRRLSIGFQSLRDETLREFGRVHTSADSLRAFEAARAAGVRSLNVDMIYAAPGQTAEQWEEDLARVLDLEPEHLSAYNLTYEPGTRFHALLRRGVLAQQPDDVELAMLAAARTLCAASGLEPYEISNYARAGERCQHNVNYWHNGPYVGLGPSAVSKVGQVRSGNPRAIGAYRERVARTGEATEWREELEQAARLGETWWLGLRLASGVDPARARDTAGFEADEDPALEVAARLMRLGLLEDTPEGRLRLTAAGLPVADAVAAEFLAAPA